MIKTSAYAALSANDKIAPHEIFREEPKPDEVLIDIKYCGICHSDIHTARSEWGPAKYPCVPGHEIVGKVISKGKKVKKFKVGDTVGVGCLVNSCGRCENCKKNEEQFCIRPIFTYNSAIPNSDKWTLGGYSGLITVNENFVLKINKNLPLDKVAPLLCAGITTYSPLKRYKVKKGSRVAIVGLGGLGHMAVKIAKAMGATVTVFSTSKDKEDDAYRLGAKFFIYSKDSEIFDSLKENFDLIINTVSASHDLNPYLRTLKIDGTMVLVGVPPDASFLQAGSLISGRKKITGSLIGGLKETQEMLNFCARKKVFSDVELINANQINEAYERTLKGQVKFRFVIDIDSMKM